MIKTKQPTAAPGILPNEYQEVLSWKVTGKPIRTILLNLAGLFLILVFGGLFFSIASILGKFKVVSQFRFDFGNTSLLFAACLLTLVLHELVHGLAMKIYGAKPKYGVIWKGLMFYATSPEYAYQRNKYIVIALAPLVLISSLVILGMWIFNGTFWIFLLGICGTLNASGAVGDIWITMIVLRYANTAYVIDDRDGIRVFLPMS